MHIRICTAEEQQPCTEKTHMPEFLPVFLHTLGFELVCYTWTELNTIEHEDAIECAMRWQHKFMPELQYCARHRTEELTTAITHWMMEPDNQTVAQLLVHLQGKVRMQQASKATKH
jgi:hypothetical protein